MRKRPNRSPAPSSDDKPVAFLDQWRIIRLHEGTPHLVGITYGHPRLREGARIVSSAVIFITPNNSFAETQNTLYRLQTSGEGTLPAEWSERVDYFLNHVWGTFRVKEEDP